LFATSLFCDGSIGSDWAVAVGVFDVEVLCSDMAEAGRPAEGGGTGPYKLLPELAAAGGGFVAGDWVDAAAGAAALADSAGAEDDALEVAGCASIDCICCSSAARAAAWFGLSSARRIGLLAHKAAAQMTRYNLEIRMTFPYPNLGLDATAFGLITNCFRHAAGSG
jgi:hypothetical protein